MKRDDESDDAPMFGGVTFDQALDGERMSTALGRVYRLMSDGVWRTIPEIALRCACSPQGASARLRDFRKEKFRDAGFACRGVERRRKGDGSSGLWEYRLVMEGRS